MASPQVSPLTKTTSYLQEVAKESKSITWPDFKKASFQFLVVLALSGILTGLLYLIDIGLLFSINKLKDFVVNK